MANLQLAEQILSRCDRWVHDLAAPTLPPIATAIGDSTVHLQFRDQDPHSVIVGKLVRATSAAAAAWRLAHAGFITEAGAIGRMLSDYCIEVTAIAEALHRGGELPRAVQDFVTQYFEPKARTAAEYAAVEFKRYVSREELMKGEVRLAQAAKIDHEDARNLRRFLNMGGDAYVHGAYETVFELYDPSSGRFCLGGHPYAGARVLHATAVALKLHELVTSIEMSAAVFGNAALHDEVRSARREMDRSEPWLQNQASPA